MQEPTQEPTSQQIPDNTTCLKCRRANKCVNAREVAFSAFTRLNIISDAYQIFELTASRCPDFSNKRKRPPEPKQLILALEY